MQKVLQPSPVSPTAVISGKNRQTQLSVAVVVVSELTWWQVMSRADQTKSPERPRANGVVRKIWSSMMEPLAVRMMVMLEMSDLSGRIGESRWTMEPFSDDGSTSANEPFIWKKKQRYRKKVRAGIWESICSETWTFYFQIWLCLRILIFLSQNLDLISK